MKTCEVCGLGTKENNGQISCFKYKTWNDAKEDKQHCIYFKETIFEEGEPLLPLQHLPVKRRRIKSSNDKRCSINGAGADC